MRACVQVRVRGRHQCSREKVVAWKAGEPLMWIGVQTVRTKCGGLGDLCIWFTAFPFLFLFSFLYFSGSELRTGVEKVGGLFQCARYLHIIYLYLRGHDARVRISLADRSQMSVHGPGLAGHHARQPYLLRLPKPSRRLGVAGCGLRGYRGG